MSSEFRLIDLLDIIYLYNHRRRRARWCVAVPQSEYHTHHIHTKCVVYIIMDYSLLYRVNHRVRRGLSLSLQCNSDNQRWRGHVTS